MTDIARAANQLLTSCMSGPGRDGIGQGGYIRDIGMLPFSLPDQAVEVAGRCQMAVSGSRGNKSC